MEADLSWKTTSKMKNKSITATIGWILPKFETYAYGTKPNVMETYNEDYLPWKTTSKMKSRSISTIIGHILPKFETYAYGTKPNVMENYNENDLPSKTTSHGRRPQK